MVSSIVAMFFIRKKHPLQICNSKNAIQSKSRIRKKTIISQ